MTTLSPTHHCEVNYEADELSKSAWTYCEQLHENEFCLSRGHNVHGV